MRAILGLIVGALLCAACSGSDASDSPAGGKGGTGGKPSGGGGSGGTPASGGSAGAPSGGGSGGSVTGGAAGAAGSDGGAGGPAYDLHAADRASCTFTSGTHTTESIGPKVPHGDALPFKHIVVLMQENRSFDEYFSELPAYGVTDVDVASPTATNPDPDGTPPGPVSRFHELRLCIQDVDHDWEPVHQQYDNGKMDGFIATNNPGGGRALGYYTSAELPYYYWMAKTFAMSDRHFCSLLGPTWPNRLFFWGATSWGNVKTGDVGFLANNVFLNSDTITDMVASSGHTWKLYRDGLLSFAVVMGLKYTGVGMSEFDKDVDGDTLPDLAIIDPNFSGSGENDEHPPTNIQLGQKFTARVLAKLLASPKVWNETVFIWYYDEHGGFYDHVPPPDACEPDAEYPPTYKFDRLGIRTPLVVAGAFAKKGYVSHTVTDITSVTRFIENRFDLPAMTARDANAWPMLDLFDFDNPPFPSPPTDAPDATPNQAGADWCSSNPPGTGTL